MNKKASVLDIIFVGALLLVFAVGILVAYRVIDAYDTQIQGMSVMPNASKDAVSAVKDHYPGIIDNAFLFLTIGLGIGAIVLAFMVRVHPAFFILFIIALILLIFFSAIFSNIYQEMAAQSELTAYADQLTFTSLILNYLPLIVGVFGSVLAIVMYKLGQGT